MDILGVQISRALTDPDNPWAQLFGDMAREYLSKEVLRSSASTENTRLAAGQVKLTVDAIADPVQGVPLPPGGIWARFMAQAQAGGVPQVGLLQELLNGPQMDGCGRN